MKPVPQKKDSRALLWEVFKWALVLFLLFPLVRPAGGMLEFVRVVAGEALLIIFIGKLFYDTVIWKFTRQRRTARQDLIALIGMALGVGLIMIVFFLLVGITLLQYFQTVRENGLGGQ